MFAGNDNPVKAFRGPWGVRIEVDGSIFYLLALLVYLSLGPDLIYGLIWAGLLFLAIYLHELGHAWACVVQNVPVRRVVLHGGGGFCEHARASSIAEDELIVAAGPLANLALWAICGVLSWSLLRIGGASLYGVPVFWDVIWAIDAFGWLNLMLFFWNLLPVQPLDGGKLFHIAMLQCVSPDAAHRITGAVGLVIALAWIPALYWIYLTWGFALLFLPSIRGHYRMMRGDLAF